MRLGLQYLRMNPLPALHHYSTGVALPTYVPTCSEHVASSPLYLSSIPPGVSGLWKNIPPVVSPKITITISCQGNQQNHYFANCEDVIHYLWITCVDYCVSGLI